VLAVGLSENFLPESARLLKVSVWVLIRISSHFARDWILRPSKLRIFFWTLESVGLIVRSGSVVSIYCSSTVSNIGGDASSIGTVDWNLLIVLAESVAMSVRIRKETTLQHLVV